jgi:hypothetical protein
MKGKGVIGEIEQHEWLKRSGREQRAEHAKVDLQQSWEAFDIQHELTRKGIEKFAADYRATLARPA